MKEILVRLIPFSNGTQTCIYREKTGDEAGDEHENFWKFCMWMFCKQRIHSHIYIYRHLDQLSIKECS